MSMRLLVDTTNRDGVSCGEYTFNANGKHVGTITSLAIQVEQLYYRQAMTLGMADPMSRTGSFRSPSI